MKHGIERIISGAVDASTDWIRRKPLLSLALAFLLIKSYPKFAMILFVAIGFVLFRSAQQPAHLVIEVDPV